MTSMLDIESGSRCGRKETKLRERESRNWSGSCGGMIPALELRRSNKERAKPYPRSFQLWKSRTRFGYKHDALVVAYEKCPRFLITSKVGTLHYKIYPILEQHDSHRHAHTVHKPNSLVMFPLPDLRLNVSK